MKKRTIINSKICFFISLIVIIVTILSVWFYGIGKHHTVIENSFFSTSILSISFFLFISIGLYNGIKLKDNLGKITDTINFEKLNFLKNFTPSEPFDFDEIEGVILSIVLWLLASIFFGYILFAFSAVIWVTILTFGAMLYWIFYRALRLVFKNASECNGNLIKSLMYGLGYTLVYNFWIYLIIAAVS
ncbi:MAG: hypothetical protein J0L86_09370 [Flavobacteriales bacterium]|nr:hypothetical protein [Flavobacteriales bacterium]